MIGYQDRKSGVAEEYEDSETVWRCVIGVTDGFKVLLVGLYQGSALTPFLFAAVMGMLTVNVRQDSLWTMISVNCNL